MDITFCIIRAQRLREINQQNLSQQKNNGGDLNEYAVPKGKKGNHMTKSNNGCVVSHNNKTITLTKAYAKLAYTPGTKEFRELSTILKAYPHLTVAMRSAKPNEEKEKHTGLTVDRMEFHIKTIEKDEAGLAEFQAVKAYYKGMNGYYGKVKGWFLKKYPNYQEIDFSDVA